MHLSSLLLAFAAVTTGVSAGYQPNLRQESPNTQPILFAGTYTREEALFNGTGKGIYTYKFDTVEGTLTPFGVTPVGINPMYVLGSSKTFSEGQKVVYAINSVSDNSTDYPETTTGFVSALTLQPDGTLAVLNTLETHGAMPVHISLSTNEDFVVVANYGGSLSMYPLKDDGSLAPETYHHVFPNGSNVVIDRQASGHTHSSMWLANSNHVVVADLGSDELFQYELDEPKQTLTSLETVHRPAGSGPRHMAQHPSGLFAYILDEISNTVGVYSVNQSAKVLESTALQNITVLPANYTNYTLGAEVHLSSNGKFLYTSNRGHNSISMFQIDQTNGTLTPLGWEDARGEFSWGFIIYGDWLIVANLVSDNMHVFAVNNETGLLSYTNNSYEIPSASCLYIGEF